MVSYSVSKRVIAFAHRGSLSRFGPFNPPPQELADLGDDAPRMEHLWDWVCPITAGKNVACMGWNKANPDLLAVGYGSYSFASGNTQQPTEGGVPAEPRGVVAFWSLKNLQHPLWHFEVKAAVTALDFSLYSPNLLAIGLYDGTVSIYDTKSRQGTPSMESDVHSGKHSDPVWKVGARAGAGATLNGPLHSLHMSKMDV
jgi:hypothetical protein